MADFRTIAGCVILVLLAESFGRGDDWPQWRGPRRDGVWREEGIAAPLPNSLTVRWRTPIGGGFAGPAVVGQRVFVSDRVLPPGSSNPESRWDRTDPVDGTERVLCLDAGFGGLIWKHEYPCRYVISYPAGPRATPTVDDGRVYALGAMGDLVCLDAADGSRIWSKNYTRDFGAKMNMWGMAGAPLVDGDRLIALVGGADGACVVALDKRTGEELWRALEAEDPGYSSPIIVTASGIRQLIVWNPLGVYALNPENGCQYWSLPFTTRMGHSIATPVFEDATGHLLVSSFFNGSMMLQLNPDRPGADVLWQGGSDSELSQSTDGLHALMSTPVLCGDVLYGICSYGQLRCLDAKTGIRRWETFAATGDGRWWNAFLIRHQDHFLICNEQGELIQAHLSRDGYSEISRAPLIKPTAAAGRRKVVWSHPAFANRCIYARNDEQILCVDLSSQATP